ncbi:DUF5134 domain-containing protein [Streptomyces sp. NPDC087851]|uniref:DUF5134 domain-containing protein n=1 Tax=Streptomyces sp. NPDC087851 TaxID=3365810 RepID=UPI00380759AE
MHGSVTAGWLLVALCATAGGYCLLRLRAGGAARHGPVGGEALMGFGMAAMAVPATVVTPPRWVWLGYAVVFGGAALRALVVDRGSTHQVHHLLGMLAMVYMAGSMATVTGGPGAAHTAAGTPLVTAALLIYYAGYVLWAGARLLPLPALSGPASGPARGAVPGAVAGAVAGPGSGPGPGGPGAVGWADRTELVPACRLSMGIAMLTMLLTL